MRIEDYCICLNPVCVIDPKFHAMARDNLRHHQNKCLIDTFDNIYQNLFDQPNLSYPFQI